MEGRDDLGGLLLETAPNAIIGWTLIVMLVFAIVATVIEGAFNWAFFTALAVVIVLLPAIAFRDPLVMPSWELVVIVSVPVLWEVLLGWRFATDIPIYFAVAALALVVVVEVHRFTAVRMNHSFAVGFVVLTTLAVAGIWNVLQWLSDVYLGTAFVLDGRSQDAINAAVMIEFIYAGIAGLGAGIVFDRYFRIRDRSPTDRTYVPPKPVPPEDVRPDDRKKLRDVIGISPRRQRQATRGMQVVLVFVLVFGLAIGDLPTIVNAAVALAITFVPALLERDYELPMDPGLVLWITTAVFLHALGSAGLYYAIDPWDHLTHALSASVVAAVGYALFRAVHLHTDEVYIPPKVMAVFILVFVLAAGVLWEILEFLIDESADVLGLEAILAQHGIDDTIVDLIFNVVGAVIVTIWGTAYLTDVSDGIAERLDRRFDGE